MSNALTLSQTNSRTQGFCKVPRFALEQAQLDPVDLYTYVDGTRSPTLLHGRSQPLTPEVLEQIESKGVQSLYVSRPHYELISRNLLEQRAEILGNTNLLPGQQFKLLQMAYTPLLEQYFQKTQCDQFVDLSMTIGGDLARLFYSATTTPNELYEYTRHRYSSFSHYINVAAYLVLLAKKQSITGAEQLQRIAAGGVLHEIGKLFLDKESSTEAASRSSRERVRYPQLGFECLLGFSTIDLQQRLMAYQHLERHDGNGGPVGIEGAEIDPWAQMLIVVKRFDNDTDVSLGSGAVDCSKALLQIADGACKEFNPELVLCWISLFQQA